MDIGTAKPTRAERSKTRHHCIDLFPPNHICSAGEYAKIASVIIEDIHQRDKLPIIAGGSGLYVKALVDGVFHGNYRDLHVRQALNEQAISEGWPALYEKLRQADPQTAAQVHENDHKRIIRALEVFQVTGKPISQVQKQETIPSSFHPVFIGIDWPRGLLYQRIEHRVDHMLETGLVNEVRHILEQGYPPELNSLDTVGYKEVISYLKGEIPYQTMVDLIKQNTRRFAKRQMTWFRKETRIQWFPVTNDAELMDVAEQVVALFKN